MTFAARVLAVAACFALLHTPSRAAAPLPYRVAVEVRWGQGGGPEAFREDLARALADTLAHGCYASVEDVPSGSTLASAELRLSLNLSHLKEELKFLDSIATSLAPGDPAKELRRMAIFEVTVDATLGAVTTATAIRQKRFVASISREPTMIGEDPQATARLQAIERIVSDLKKPLCKNPDKLDKEIRSALAEPGETPAAAH